MPRGGHTGSGPISQHARIRSLHGSKTRPRHRKRGNSLQVPLVTCEPPTGLSTVELEYWDYYARQLMVAGHLPLKARDALAKYCTVLAIVADLRRQLASRKRDDIKRDSWRKELRLWVLASRLYEHDLLINPSSIVRTARESGVVEDQVGDDPFSDFDEPAGIN